MIRMVRAGGAGGGVYDMVASAIISVPVIVLLSCGHSVLKNANDSRKCIILK